jgi:GTP pyrophosphokinase
MIQQVELLDRVKTYEPGFSEDLLNRAFAFAVKAHESQKRASGDPYIFHPLEVAGILSDLKLDTASIVTGLLHDTVEDSDATLEDIEAGFGKEIARLVDGVTKLTRLNLQTDQVKEAAENFRKLVLAMSRDIRVLLVKLADRLHNMRTLRHISKPDKRRRIATETLEIYAPLAERMGMQDIKSELEELAFAELQPEAHESMLARLAFLRAHGGDIVSRVTDELSQTMRKGGVKAWVSGREKTAYSVWRKMHTKNIGFEQLSDIMAFRILVDTVEDCYRALGVIHSSYSVVPGRFKDYISTPKRNGYRSLHTCVIGPARQRIEVQIRTRDMHEIAEIGVAAHWMYKQGTDRTDGTRYRWLRELLDILENAAGPEEFLEHTKLEMFQDQVFCFTPKGDLFALPRGATPVDFAYAIHSEIGDTCVGAKINGRMMPLRTELANGDQVEIVTSNAQTPSPDWERFVATGKARAHIRRFVRVQERDEYVNLGRSIVEQRFRKEGHEFSQDALAGALKILNQKSVEDIYARVGEGLLAGRDVVNAVYPGKQIMRRWGKIVSFRKARDKLGRKKKHVVPIRGLIPGMAVHYAGCCHPLPGDRIVGIVTTGKGVTIHTIDCDTLGSFTEMPERWLDVAWGDEGEEPDKHVGRLRLIVLNEPGSLSSLATVIAHSLANIHNLKITNRSSDFFELIVDVEVKDLKHLTNIIAALRATPAINSVERARR